MPIASSSSPPALKTYFLFVRFIILKSNINLKLIFSWYLYYHKYLYHSEYRILYNMYNYEH
jgi:hypothetical protein